MEKQGKTKSVEQSITAGIVEETTTPSEVMTWFVIFVESVKDNMKRFETLNIETLKDDVKSIKHRLAVMESLSPNYKPVTVNIVRSGHATAIETMFVEGYTRHSFDELDCKNFASPDDLLSYNEDHLTEYLPRGSLENQLFKRYSTSLPWSTRLKIVVGVAKGLAFLHDTMKTVIYRDFKASNIILDFDNNTKLSDFGLAKDGPEGEDTHVLTRVMGTQGYAAPEYIMTGNMFSQLDNNELHRSYGNVPRDPEFQHDYTYKHSQHIRKDPVQCLSSSVVSIVVSLGIFYNIWSSQLSIFQVQPLHKEHHYRLSIWPSLLGLFGFMVFVCAVAVMNLVGAPFTSMQKAMLIFLAILMHLQSANSIIEVFVTLVGGLSMGWHAFGKKATTK